MILAKENSIYIYFEVIEQLEPKNVWDIGMLLKRAGAVSKGVMERQIPDNIRLDGVDFFPDTELPVWKNLYDEVIDDREFVENILDEDYLFTKYDLAVFLDTDSLCERIASDEIMTYVVEYLVQHMKCLLVDSISFVEKYRQKNWKVQDLKVDEDVYYLIIFQK